MTGSPEPGGHPRGGWFGRRSIRVKLMLIILASSLAAVLLAGGAFLTYEWIALRQKMVDDLGALAEILGDNCSASVDFGVPVDAQDALDRLGTYDAYEPITAAAIYDADNVLFATYRRGKPTTDPIPVHPPDEGHRWVDGGLVEVRSIRNDGRRVGCIFLHTDLHQFHVLLAQSAAVLLGAIVLAALAAFVLARRLQRTVSGPVLELAETARAVARSEDYSLRATPRGEDELAELTYAFNTMLGEIETRAEEVRESRRNLAALFDRLRDLIVVLDPSLRIMAANPAALTRLGYAEEDLMRMTLLELHPEGRRSELEKQLEGMSEGDALIYGIPFQTRDGPLIPVEVVLTPGLWAGRPALFGAARDVTERERAERELRRLRNLLTNIVDSMPSVLVGMDSEGRVTQWNREAERVSGVSTGEALGQRLQDVYPGLIEDMDRVRRAMVDRETIREERRESREGGEVRLQDITVYPLISNGVGGVVIRVDDVTQRVRIEEMMVQSEKMLSVGGLAAGMAHEINNPLAGILQSLQVLRNRLSPDLEKNRTVARECGTEIEHLSAYLEARGLLGMMENVSESATRAARIVENMLAFSRKSGVDPTPCDLGELLDRTVELAASDYDLKKQFDFREIRIRREFDEDTPEVLCQRGEIQQVFLNLLTNGAHAMAEQVNGEVPPQLTLGVEGDGAGVRVEIGDNGPGMSEQTRRRVFEPFFTTKPVGEGTGLGLSVSYFIVTENHGGTMEVESAPGRGTTFSVWLPVDHGFSRGERNE